MSGGPDPRRYAEASFEVQCDVLIAAVLANPQAGEVMRRAAELGLPDWALIAGAIYKPVWSFLTGRDAETGINDYDLAYCDTSDLSWEAEDVWIQRCAPVFADINREVEVCNQARVPIWFSEKYGVRRDPIHSTREAVAQFASRSHAIGLTLDTAGKPHIIAPYGLDELFSLHALPFSGIAHPEGWNAKARENMAIWPELVFEMVELQSSENARA